MCARAWQLASPTLFLSAATPTAVSNVTGGGFASAAATTTTTTTTLSSLLHDAGLRGSNDQAVATTVAASGVAGDGALAAAGGVYAGIGFPLLAAL